MTEIVIRDKLFYKCVICGMKFTTKGEFKAPSKFTMDVWYGKNKPVHIEITWSLPIKIEMGQKHICPKCLLDIMEKHLKELRKISDESMLYSMD